MITAVSHNMAFTISLLKSFINLSILKKVFLIEIQTLMIIWIVLLWLAFLRCIKTHQQKEHESQKPRPENLPKVL